MALVHLSPYEPSRDHPWDGPRFIAHLLRRSGFGAPPEQVDGVLKQVEQDGLEAGVNSLFDEAEDQEAEFQDTFERLRGEFADFGQADQLQAWWCYRMLRTRTPLREKLTLFWHGHFATSVHKVEDTSLMHQQCATLRKLAWGNFADLALAVCRDPAMLVYLDGETNTKAQPNENFAREFLELFTLGIGNYQEKDVREAARAFTGWSRNGAEFVFNSDAHDSGSKHFLGREGPWDGGQIIDIIMEQPALPRFLARKLLVFFACPKPSEAIVAEAAEVLAGSGMNIKQFLTTLFLSKVFYSGECRRTRIASPAELVVGTCRSLGVRLTGHQVRDHLAAMGLELFGPPNVKGWDGERKWINSSTWAARTSFARELATLERPNSFGAGLDLGRLVPDQLAEPDAIVDLLVAKVLEGRLGHETHSEIARFLVTKDGKPQPEAFRTDAGFRNGQVREALAVLLALPEYHTC
jgi:uncharacterized protein (DUF1800 family)